MRPACLVLLAATAGCTADVPVGIAYIRLSESDGDCKVLDPYAQTLTPLDDFFADLVERPYRRVHGTAAFQGGGSWADGHNIAVPWRDDDGQISRFFMDVGPNRGYGVSLIPDTSERMLEQATGLVQWRGDVRTFAGLRAHGYMAYSQDDENQPKTLYAAIAFDGVGPANEPLCRVVGMHATTTHERFETYDPAWLAADPSVMIFGEVQPAFDGDVAPTYQPVAPTEPVENPGGVAPPLMQLLPVVFGNGSSGGDSCD